MDDKKNTQENPTQLKIEISKDGTIFIKEDTNYIAHTKSSLLSNENLEELMLVKDENERMEIFKSMIDKLEETKAEYFNFFESYIYKEPLELLNFYKSLKQADFKACNIELLKYDNMRRSIELAEEKIKQVNEILLDNPYSEETADQCIYLIKQVFTEKENERLFYYKNSSPKEQAKKQNAIFKVGGRQATISNKDYAGFLDTRPNDYAYIAKVGKGFFENFKTDAAGNIMPPADEKEAAALNQAINNGSKNELDQPLAREFLAALMPSIQASKIEEYGNSITLYLPTFCKEMSMRVEDVGIDAAGNYTEEYNNNAKRSDFWDKLHTFEEYIGILNRSNYMRFLTIEGYDTEAKTLTISMPYMFNVGRQFYNNTSIPGANEKKQIPKPTFNYLMHSDIAKERNKYAVALVTTITNAMLQRGAKPIGEFKENKEKPLKDRNIVTYRTTYKTLIENTPLLAERLKECDNARDKNKTLERAFTRAYVLLKEKTDLYDYFIDLKIVKGIIPTSTYLNEQLVITHYGQNTNYIKPINL